MVAMVPLAEIVEAYDETSEIKEGTMEEGMTGIDDGNIVE